MANGHYWGTEIATKELILKETTDKAPAAPARQAARHRPPRAVVQRENPWRWKVFFWV